MMAQSRAESTRDTYNYGQYINQFPPNTIKVIRQFERIQKKICRHIMSIMFNETCINEEMLPKYTYINIYTCMYIYIYIYIYIYTRGAYDKFPDFFVWALLLIVHTWNSSPLWSNFLRLQCTCTTPTTSGTPHGSHLVWACQWPSSQPLSSPQLSHNDTCELRELPKVTGSKVWTI